MKLLLLLFVASVLVGCHAKDQNREPIYGKETGLPANCHAFVQYAIDSYRAKKYSAEDTMAALERNCGVAGQLWYQN